MMNDRDRSKSLSKGFQYDQTYAYYNTNSFQSSSILQKLEDSGRVPSKQKYRRMICQTYVSTGACPYHDKCVFLHDQRIGSNTSTKNNLPVKLKQKLSSCGENKDTFYWPDMEVG